MFSRHFELPKIKPSSKNIFRAQSPCPLIVSFVTALVGDALLRAAAAGIGKLRKLVFQRMPAGFDSGHVIDELPKLAR
jgi:hypothetical protein